MSQIIRGIGLPIITIISFFLPKQFANFLFSSNGLFARYLPFYRVLFITDKKNEKEQKIVEIIDNNEENKRELEDNKEVEELKEDIKIIRYEDNKKEINKQREEEKEENEKKIIKEKINDKNQKNEKKNENIKEITKRVEKKEEINEINEQKTKVSFVDYYLTLKGVFLPVNGIQKNNNNKNIQNNEKHENILEKSEENNKNNNNNDNNNEKPKMPLINYYLALKAPQPVLNEKKDEKKEVKKENKNEEGTEGGIDDFIVHNDEKSQLKSTPVFTSFSNQKEENNNKKQENNNKKQENNNENNENNENIIEKEFYTLEELQKKPSHLDQNNLEMFLSDDEFLKVFKQTKSDWNMLHKWKKNSLKKAVKL